MSPKRLAECAVMAALLCAIQFALGFISGVELVTPVFAAFCYSAGARSGAFTAVAFSLLRCLIYGFYPSAIILYLIYYPLFALAFSLSGKVSPPRRVSPLAAGVASFSCAALALSGAIKISIIYSFRIKILLWALCVIFAALSLGGIFLPRIKNSDRTGKSVNAATLAGIMTVFFTLLDDVITPLFFGYSKQAAEVYFYGGFLAMLPQTVCATLSTFLLFDPLTRALRFVIGEKYSLEDKDDENR